MKWRLRKKLSSSPSPISNAFPISWVSKFKLKREIPLSVKDKAQQYPHMPLRGVELERTRSTIKDAGRVNQPNQCNPFASEQGDGLVGEFSHEISFKCHKVKDAQTVSVGNENEQMRNSVYIGGGTQEERASKPGKFRVCSLGSPSRRESCKIKALEEHKKKKKKEKQEIPSEQVTSGMESFAVVKHSQDPQHDFRDSMMEMIMDKGIKKPEEMEELLACYLTLNLDEYHDLIIKVFRQVWRELDDMRALNRQLQELNLVFDN